MHVVKRNGDREPVSFDRILERLTTLATVVAAPLARIDCTLVAQKTIQGLREGVTTEELDVLAAETAAYLATTDPEYGDLAARIVVSNLHKKTPADLVACLRRSDLDPAVVAFAEAHAPALQAALQHARDFQFTYFGFKTLERSYLRCDADGNLVERPQCMYMRVALGVHSGAGDLAAVLETYEALSKGEVTHATPTLFNSGTRQAQMASCFLMQMPADSIDGIFEAITWCGKISKHAGGIGLAASNVRAKGSRIRGSGGVSNGLVPMLQVLDKVARYVDQGGGKRKGAIAIYLEPWHADIFDVLEMKKNHGVEELKARDLFYGLWIPDLFMQRVDEDGTWSLFCPDQSEETKALPEMWGADFELAYKLLEKSGMSRRVVSARALWTAILDAQVETGGPYLLYKDACNAKSNHKHLGTLKCSNLCTEILEYVAPDEIAVCNLASVALPTCLTFGAGGENKLAFDFEKLETATRLLTRNLNRVIDVSYYAVKEAETSNRRHRPIGIGVQGLADVFMALRLDFDSHGAKRLNKDIFETMYYAALDESTRVAEKMGAPYRSFPGSPLSAGVLQPDLWNVELTDGRHDWTALRRRVIVHGAANSLLLAPMPTASTAQILGNTECFEPLTSNMYARRVLSGEFPVINKYLVDDLRRLGLWTEATRNAIKRDNGSVQNVPGLPAELKSLYRTVWELKMRTVIDLAADRGAFICQSQSLNLFVADATHAKLTAMHFYAWRKGLKTGQYYLRTRAAADAQKVTVAPAQAASQETPAEPEDGACPIGCTSCSA